MKINKEKLVIKNLHTQKELDELENRIISKKIRKKLDLGSLLAKNAGKTQLSS